MTRPVAPAPRQAMARRDFRQGVRKGGLRSLPIHRAPWPDTTPAATHQARAARPGPPACAGARAVGAGRRRARRGVVPPGSGACRASRPAAYTERVPPAPGACRGAGRRRVRRGVVPLGSGLCRTSRPAAYVERVPPVPDACRGSRPASRTPGCCPARVGPVLYEPTDCVRRARPVRARRVPWEPTGAVYVGVSFRSGRACAVRADRPRTSSASRPCRTPVVGADRRHVRRGVVPPAPSASRTTRSASYADCVPPARAAPPPGAGRSAHPAPPRPRAPACPTHSVWPAHPACPTHLVWPRAPGVATRTVRSPLSGAARWRGRAAGPGPGCAARRARANPPPQPPSASRTNALRNLPDGSSSSATRRKSPSRG